MSVGDWERLGARIKEERIRRGFRTRNEFAAAADLSSTTLDYLEHGRKTSYGASTLGNGRVPSRVAPWFDHSGARRT